MREMMQQTSILRINLASTRLSDKSNTGAELAPAALEMFWHQEESFWAEAPVSNDRCSFAHDLSMNNPDGNSGGNPTDDCNGPYRGTEKID
jgi:hypothetical protein